MAGARSAQGNAFVVPVSAQVARLAGAEPGLSFSSNFTRSGLIGSDTIQPGDVLSLRIWENVDNGLLAEGGLNNTALDHVQVDGDGNIFVPYAGRIKAAGNSPEALRDVITRKLADQTPDPQVLVTRAAGDGATVSVMGSIGAQGVYPLERPTRRLSAMIAKAGGVTVEPEIAQIVVTRGGQTGRVWLKDLYANSALDIALRAGDVILVESDQRNFTALGATGAQVRIPFTTRRLTAVEALAQVGGLSSTTADPTGVFVFRDESESVARSVLGRPDLIGTQRIAYVLDLTEPNGIFNARDFIIRDGDTVYVTEAPYAQWTKILSSFIAPLSTVSAVQNLGN